VYGMWKSQTVAWISRYEGGPVVTGSPSISLWSNFHCRCSWWPASRS